MDTQIIKKNSNEFSAAKEALNEVNNLEFKSGEQDFLNVLSGTMTDTSKSYVWSATSAITDQVGEVLYEKVLNYIDDIADIDTCAVKPLQSMIQLLGTDFTVFKSLESCPLELMQLMDVFSMRKDYLLRSDKVCSQLAKALSSYYSAENASGILSSALSADDGSGIPIPTQLSIDIASINDTRRKIGFDELSASPFVLRNVLDNIISSTYYDVLTSNVCARYNTLSNELIYEQLSASILCSGFDIPNKYAEDIYALKVKWNIPSEFDPSDEADLIDSGISSLDSYSHYEKAVLSIEYKRRNEARNDLEPCSRYSYYKEAKVREFFKFIETEYNDLFQTYQSSEQYALDDSFIEINGLLQPAQLLREQYGTLVLNNSMIEAVAKRLLGLTTSIRSIREYLKSHVQRNYMKGTFMLISYVINEYLKQNIYPSLNQIGVDIGEYSADDNQTTLTEYIDQTQYNNIKTDISADIADSSLNPQFWKANGVEGAADMLDTTSIFKAEDKSMLINICSFNPEQITDFYTNMLKCFSTDHLSAVSTKLYSFLSSVFAFGTDNSYLDEHGKIMCELPNTAKTTDSVEYMNSRKFTADVDSYVYDLSAAYSSCENMLSSYSPIANISIHSQLDSALTEFKEKAYLVYSETAEEKLKITDGIIAELADAQSQLKSFQQTFNDLTTQYSTLTASFLQYTGDFEASTSPYFVYQFHHYTELINNTFVLSSQNIRKDLLKRTGQIETGYVALMKQVEAFRKTCICTTDLNIPFPPVFEHNPIKLILSIEPVNQPLSTFVQSTNVFEVFYENSSHILTVANATVSSKKIQLEQELNEKIRQHLAEVQYEEYDSLSLLLSSYYDKQFSLLSAVDVISSMLDYTGSDWYQYKKQLFLKYTGNQIGDTPYYYLENSRHPSFQIHPCLSNFIESLDFSYPVQDLAGIARGTIDYIVKNNLDVKLDNDGYLLSVWNNPLNGNSDYLSKYEKTCHTDEDGAANALYGYDGPFYPLATSTSELNAAIESLSETGEITDSWYRGLNLSDREKSVIKERLTTYKALINDLCYKNGDADITKYGLDAYGNCYSLIKYKYDNASTPKNVLWIKFKNHPYAFPALAYTTASNGIPSMSMSQITFDKEVSNEYINLVDRISLGTHNLYSPTVDDFIFSKDKTTLLMVMSVDGRKVPVHVNIAQKYVRDENTDMFIRTFEKDHINGTEHCISSDMPIACFYTAGQDIGQLYAEKKSQIRIDVFLDTYKRNTDLQYSETSASYSVDCSDYPIAAGQDVKVDCRPDGSFSIAYIADPSLASTQVSAFDQFETDYSTGPFASYMDTHDKLIVSKDFVIAGNQIEQSNSRAYLPYVEMGFIPLVKSNSIGTTRCSISASSLQDDLDLGKAMMFQIYGPSCETSDAGIDFKFACPIHAFENSPVSFVDQSYHRDNTGSCPCYMFENMHYLESDYNRYVKENDDAAYWDATVAEREVYLSVRNEDLDTYGDFLKLANYDVQQYLSALRDEDGTTSYETGNISDEISQEEVQYITTPYLVDRSALVTTLSTYVFGHYSGTRPISKGDYKLAIDGAELSISWLKNDAGTIKLDFNALYYIDTELTEAMKVSNVRNRDHLFLNLDRPGDSGYLKVYRDNMSATDHSHRKWYMLFIKNISDTEHPRFVMKNIDVDQTYAQSRVAGVNSKAVKAKKNTTVNVQTLGLEGFETKFIEFT